MARLKTWGVSDAFWGVVEPLVPTSLRVAGRVYKRRPGGGRKPKYSDRLYFEAIVYVLRTGIIWNSLPREMFGGLGSSAVHKRFLDWEAVGFFDAVWRKGLAEYDELEGISWKWQSADSSSVKAALAKESVGPNPTDRGKKRHEAPRPRRRKWRPSLARRIRGE